MGLVNGLLRCKNSTSGEHSWRGSDEQRAPRDRGKPEVCSLCNQFLETVKKRTEDYRQALEEGRETF
jgi:hypothetical protein